MSARAYSTVLIPAVLLVAFAPRPAPQAAPITFEDEAPRSGLQFVLRNAATPEKRQIETMVGGVAVLDYNSDGRPDVYFANGAAQPELRKTGPQWWNRLYRNDGGWRFTDVTAQAGVAGEGFATGVAAADYDNDGHADLFVAAVGRTQLFRNRGDGSFEDATARAGVQARQPWPIAAGWFDYDRDGYLDLFVVNYVVWDPRTEPFCGDLQRNLRAYCHPKYYRALPNTLFRNRGDGTFADVSGQTGILAHPGKGMGVAFSDYDSDGDPDVFVANDTVPNFLFRNDGGRFAEVALESGVAFSEDGRALSSMGADFRDLDNDGRDDLFVSALMNETFPLFRNLGRGLFQDFTNLSGVGKSAYPFSGWSNGVFDFNNDGWKDLFVAAGDVNDNAEQFSSRSSRQRNLVFANLGGARFEETGARAGASFQQPGMHRGAAFADFDGDGRMDAVVSRIGEPARLFRNTSPGGNGIAFRLRGRKSNRDGIGARIRIVGESGLEQWSQVTASVGYACSSDVRVHFGLGRDRKLRQVEVRWPSGAVASSQNTEIKETIEIVEDRTKVH